MGGLGGDDSDVGRRIRRRKMRGKEKVDRLGNTIAAYLYFDDIPSTEMATRRRVPLRQGLPSAPAAFEANFLSLGGILFLVGLMLHFYS